MKNQVSRRSVLQGSAAGAIAIGASAISSSRVLAKPSAESLINKDAIRVGVIGTSRGLGVAKDFQRAGITIGAVCDVDESRLANAKRETDAPNAYRDLRELIADKTLDGVIVATPDHWHTPAAILALKAGKHVYVEKPCSHNIREGRLLIDAARDAGRVVQVGTQTRSTPFAQRAIKKVHDGEIGELKMVRAWNSQQRSNIGHADPSEPPKGFDYDLWVGPAPKPPYQSNRHHYTWHWWYDFGTGDAGNDGVHELDISVWGLNVDRHPDIVSGHGVKLFFDDDQQFPDTQHVTFEYLDPSGDPMKKKVLVFENRIWSPYTENGYENGVIFYGTEGYLVLAKGSGFKLFGRRNELRHEESGQFSTIEHAKNFRDAIENGTSVNAPAEIGHLGATLAHMANLLGRFERSVIRFDPSTETVIDDEEVATFVRREYRDGHWAAPE